MVVALTHFIPSPLDHSFTQIVGRGVGIIVGMLRLFPKCQFGSDTLANVLVPFESKRARCS